MWCVKFFSSFTQFQLCVFFYDFHTNYNCFFFSRRVVSLSVFGWVNVINNEVKTIFSLELTTVWAEMKKKKKTNLKQSHLISHIFVSRWMWCEKESSYQSVCDSAAEPDQRMSFCTRKKKTIPIYPSPSITDLYSVFFLLLFCFSTVFIFISRVCRSFPPLNIDRWLNEFCCCCFYHHRMLMWSTSNSNKHQINCSTKIYQ